MWLIGPILSFWLTNHSSSLLIYWLERFSSMSSQSMRRPRKKTLCFQHRALQRCSETVRKAVEVSVPLCRRPLKEVRKPSIDTTGLSWSIRALDRSNKSHKTEFALFWFRYHVWLNVLIPTQAETVWMWSWSSEWRERRRMHYSAIRVEIFVRYPRRTLRRCITDARTQPQTFIHTRIIFTYRSRDYNVFKQ